MHFEFGTKQLHRGSMFKYSKVASERLQPASTVRGRIVKILTDSREYVGSSLVYLEVCESWVNDSK